MTEVLRGPGGSVSPRHPVSPLVGLDLVEVGRFERALLRHPRLLERLFTPAEIAYCLARSRPGLHLAARFAAKEAVGKLLGQGVLVWKDIEIRGPEPIAKGEVCSRSLAPVNQLAAAGAPRVILHGSAAEAAKRQGIASVAVSLSHTESLAGACAVGLRSES